MTNLLEETLEKLNNCNKTEDDVLWVGNSDIYFTWDDFKNLAEYCEYDDGYGAQEIACDLMIVGKDFWLERGEYDGSEWWELKQTPIKPNTYKVPSELRTGWWNGLS